MNDSITLDDVYKDIRKVVFSWIKDYHDRQDVMQESLLIAWRAIGEGENDPAIIRGKTRSYCRQYLSKRGRTPTGSTRKGSTMGREEERGRVTREKMHNYIQEFRAIHDRKPNASEISKGLGIPYRTIKDQMPKLYMFANSLHREDVELLSADVNLGNGQGSEVLNIIDQYKSDPSHEEDSLTRVAVWSAMNDVLTPTERHMVLRYIFQDEAYAMIEHTEGLPGRHGIKRGVARSLVKLKPVLEDVL